MARTVSVPQRSGTLSDPLLYETLSRMIAAINSALTVSMAPSIPTSPSGTITPTNPVTRLVGGGTVRTIGAVDFDVPIYLIASTSDVELETGGNIGAAAIIKAGTACALVQDKTVGVWWPIAGGGIADGDKGDITVSSGGTVFTIDAGAVSTSKMGGDVTAAGKSLLDDADAAAQRTTLGLGTAATLDPVGVRRFPVAMVNTARAISSGDANSMLLIVTSGSLTFDNASGCQVGDWVVIVNANAGAATVTQGTGVSLYVSGSNTPGNRTLAPYSLCTFAQHVTNNWIGWGVGLT